VTKHHYSQSNFYHISNSILEGLLCICSHQSSKKGEQAKTGRDGQKEQRCNMLACCRDTVTRSNGFKIIRNRVRPINTHLVSTGGVLHVYSQERRRRGGTTQQDSTQSFCENSSASFKRSLNLKFVLIYIIHNVIVCDLLYPIVAVRTLQGSTDPPCTLDMRIYPSDMMIIPLVLSYPNSIPTITGRFRGVNHRFCSRPSALSHHLWLSTRTIQPP